MVSAPPPDLNPEDLDTGCTASCDDWPCDYIHPIRSGYLALSQGEAEALAADWDRRFPESAPHTIDGYKARR